MAFIRCFKVNVAGVCDGQKSFQKYTGKTVTVKLKLALTKAKQMQ